MVRRVGLLALISDAARKNFSGFRLRQFCIPEPSEPGGRLRWHERQLVFPTPLAPTSRSYTANVLYQAYQLCPTPRLTRGPNLFIRETLFELPDLRQPDKIQELLQRQ